jgi:hypothetical protein
MRLGIGQETSGKRKDHRWNAGHPILSGFWLFGSIPGWPARSGSFELGTSRVVGKQGERGEA